MPITKTTVTGPIQDANGVAYTNAVLRFKPSGPFGDDAANTVIAQSVVEVPPDPSTGAFSVDLAPSDEAHYSVELVQSQPSQRMVYPIGLIYVPASGPVALEDLLPIFSPNVPTNAELLAALSAAVTQAEGAAGGAFADAAATSATQAATDASIADTRATEATLAAKAAGAPLFSSLAAGEAATVDGDVFMVQIAPGTAVYERQSGSGTLLGWLGELLFEDAPTLFASGLTGFSAGQIFRTRVEGDAYKVVSTGEHRSTAGGVKLKVQMKSDGSASLAALALDDTGATNETARAQALFNDVEILIVPVGTFWAALTNTSAKTIDGVDKDRSILTTEAQTNGTTLTVGADLELRNLTVKGHPTSAASKTINHTGAHKVKTRNVLFTGTNHSPGAGLLAVGDYQLSEFYTTVQPAGLGALCWSPLGVFKYCHFTGARTIEARDSKFYWCNIGDETTQNAVHIPDGETTNAGAPTGYTGIPEFHDCIITSGGSGITEGNAGHVKLRRTRVNAGLSSVGAAALYARSSSTIDAQDCHITSGNNGTAVSFAKTVPQDPNNIGLAGDSILKRCRLDGEFSSLAVPALSEIPSTIGEAVLVDCSIIGGEDEISPKTSTYYRHATEKFLDYTDAVSYAASDTTQRFRFKGDGMKVAVTGSDAAKTGCHLSHLDLITGLPHPDGMRIQVRYGGVSSRFVTFASGATDDGGAMYFRGDVSTFAVTQQGSYWFILDNNTWRQI